jgi:hypothetical protein
MKIAFTDSIRNFIFGEFIMAWFQGRHGWYALSYEDNQRLKEAHGLLLRAYRDVKRNIRWNKKLEENRRGEEPEAPEWLIENGYHVLDKKTFYGLGFKTFKDSDRKTQDYYLHVLRQYQQARRPVATKEEVRPLNLPDDLWTVVEKLKAFYAVPAGCQKSE